MQKINILDSSDSLADWCEALESYSSINHIDLGLERLRVVATRLNVLSLNAKVVTIAGTNGKGSTVALLNSILTNHGFRVGLYTSPHINSILERITIENQHVSAQCFIDALIAVREQLQDTHLSYFEYITLAALCIFKQNDLDFIVLEVGLGGRLDATNIVDADYCAITSLGFDHEEFLGNTIDSIAREKAGIMKHNSVCVCSATEATKVVVDVAKSSNCQLSLINKDFHYSSDGDSWSFYSSDISFKNLSLPKLLLQNAVTATALAAKILTQDLDYNLLNLAYANTSLAFRCQLLAFSPTIIVDVAHNEQSAVNLASFVERHKSASSGKCYSVFGVLKDKNVKAVVDPMIPLVDQWYLCDLQTERSASMLDYVYIFNNAQYYNNMLDLVSSLKLTKNDLLVVFGSFYLTEYFYKNYKDLHENIF